MPYGDRVLIHVVNITVLIAFATDYLVEFALASDRPVYLRSEYLSLLIVVAQALTLVPALAAFGVLRGLRAVRLIRLFAIVARAAAIEAPRPRTVAG